MTHHDSQLARQYLERWLIDHPDSAATLLAQAFSGRQPDPRARMHTGGEPIDLATSWVAWLERAAIVDRIHPLALLLATAFRGARLPPGLLDLLRRLQREAALDEGQVDDLLRPLDPVPAPTVRPPANPLDPSDEARLRGLLVQIFKHYRSDRARQGFLDQALGGHPALERIAGWEDGPLVLARTTLKAVKETALTPTRGECSPVCALLDAILGEDLDEVALGQARSLFAAHCAEGAGVATAGPFDRPADVTPAVAARWVDEHITIDAYPYIEPDQLRRIVDVMPAVVYIQLRSDPIVCGTGFMITPDLLLTARHVAQAIYEAMAGAQFLFFFEQDEANPSQAISACRARIAGQGMVFAGQGLQDDYALIRLGDTPWIGRGGDTQSARGFRPAPLAARLPRDGERVALVHHPACRTKQITIAPDSRITRTGATTFDHRGSTQGGSSGAPVIAVDDGLIIGVHKGSPLVGGQADLDTRKATSNLATCVARFVADLRTREPALYEEALAHQPELALP